MNNIFNRIGRFIEDKRRAVLIARVVLILGAFGGSARLGWATGLDTMASPDSHTYMDYQEFNRYFGNETFIVLVKGSSTVDLVKLNNIKLIDTIEQQMSSVNGVQSVVGPGFALRQAMTKIGCAVITSGLTVIGGFGALLFARDFPMLTDFGMLTMINVGFALVCSLVVLPILIVAIDRRKERHLSEQTGGK